MERLDDTDLQILRTLQKNAKLTTKELADAVHLTPTPVFERQKRLEKRGYIKKYVAILEKEPSMEEGAEGLVSLPLRPDVLNRPYQIVDHEHGKTAITQYQYLGNRRIALWPQTGRTHQLRVHCAHAQGLNAPILGDELYGSRSADRLYLHAASIQFTHPITQQPLFFESEAPF
jgi:tRNA pseudouridine32 synthase/23S rRNA pseudouridine746 synthase